MSSWHIPYMCVGLVNTPGKAAACQQMRMRRCVRAPAGTQAQPPTMLDPLRPRYTPCEQQPLSTLSPWAALMVVMTGPPRPAQVQTRPDLPLQRRCSTNRSSLGFVVRAT